MTAGTVNPGELALVLILVAEDALGARVILELCPLRVASIAGLLRVSSLEREAGHLMVEAGVVPAPRVVALRAGRIAKGLSVGVEVEVAAPTAGLDRPIEPPGVAAGAVHLSVSSLKRKAAHRVMIKAEIAEAALLVAALAGGPAELPPVLILMAARAV